MATIDSAALHLLRRLQELEHRLAGLAGDVKALERHAAEVDDLRNEVGKLKLEVEEMGEE